MVTDRSEPNDLADAARGLLHRSSDIRRTAARVDPHAAGHGQIVRADVDRPELADAIDAVGARDGVTAGRDDIGRGRFADEQALRLAVHQHADRHQEYADRPAAPR